MNRNKKIGILIIFVVALFIGIGWTLGIWDTSFRESKPHFPVSDDLVSGDPFDLPTTKTEPEPDKTQEVIEQINKKLADNEGKKVVSPFKIVTGEDMDVSSASDTEKKPSQASEGSEAKPTLEEQVKALTKPNEKEVLNTGDEFEKNYREILAGETITDEQVAKFLYKDSYKMKLAEGANYETLINELLHRINSLNKYEAVAAGIVLGKFLEVGEAETVALVLQRGGLTSLGKGIVIDALSRLGDARTFRILYDELNRTTEPDLRDKIVEAIGSLNDKRAVSVFYNIIDSRDRQFDSPYTRYYAISGLARTKKDEARRTLDSEFNTFVGRSYARHFQIAREYTAGVFDPKRTDVSIEQGVKRQELYYRGTRYLLYVPTRAKTDTKKSKVLVCIPGIDYAYIELHDICSAAAQKYSMAALTVIFDIETFPRYWSLNLPGPRSDHRLLDILKHLSKYANLDTREIYLFGDYEGGELVQAMALFYPQMIGRAMFMANRLVQLDPGKMFPEGIGLTPYDLDLQADVVDFLKTDVAFLKPINFRNKQVMDTLEEYKKVYEDLGITPRFLVREYRESRSGDSIVYGDKLQEILEQYLFQGY